MSRARHSEPIQCLFDNGLWVPGRALLIGEIDNEEYRRVRKGLLVLAQNQEPITIYLNSAGGSSLDGLAIFGAISRLPNHVTIIVEGEASSMGAVILQAGDIRLADPRAVLLLHDGTEETSEIHVRDFERRAEESKRARTEMYEIFAEKTGKSKSYFRRKLAHDWILTAENALKEGLIDGFA